MSDISTTHDTEPSATVPLGDRRTHFRFWPTAAVTGAAPIIIAAIAWATVHVLTTVGVEEPTSTPFVGWGCFVIGIGLLVYRHRKIYIRTLPTVVLVLLYSLAVLAIAGVLFSCGLIAVLVLAAQDCAPDAYECPV